MITVAGTVFSITIAALSLASSQFGPRLLRNFTRDRGNQIVLGTFIATFLYCLLVLRTVRNEDEGGFVPNLAVTGGVFLAAASLGVLIYFIHHVASSIQAERIVAAVGEDLRRDIRRLSLPTPPGPGGDAPPARLPDRPPCPVLADCSGYVQAIDRDGLADIARDGGVLLQLSQQPGDFVCTGQPLVQVWTEAPRLEPGLAERLRGAVSLGNRRTPVQDVRYAARQLGEIAARALSPGINDPYTAMACTDWLVDGLVEMGRRDMPSGHRRDAEGKLLLIEHPVDFAELLRVAFDPLRSYGASSAMVAEHVLRSLARLAELLSRPEHYAALLQEARLTQAAALTALQAADDQRRVQEAFAAVCNQLAPPERGNQACPARSQDSGRCTP